MENDRIQRLQKMLEDDPKDIFILYALGMELKNGNNVISAIEYLELVYQLDPTYLGVYYQLGKLYESLDQPENALAIFKEGIQRAAVVQDLHTLAELKNAKTNLEMEL
jgi:tetratricopeptide (TPR) repeat protein